MIQYNSNKSRQDKLRQKICLSVCIGGCFQVYITIKNFFQDG